MPIHARKAVLIAALATVWPVALQATPIFAEQAAEIMARAQAVDLKCRFLDTHQRDKMSKFTARAELAAAKKASPAEIKAAMQRGRSAGKAADCSPDEKAFVEKILSSALLAAGETRQAAKLVAPVAKDASQDVIQEIDPPAKQAAAAGQSASLSAAATVPPAPASPTAQSNAQPPAQPLTEAAVAGVDPPMVPTPEPAPKPRKAGAKPAQPKSTSADLGAYERLTEAYYRARRCGGINIGNTYQAVVAEHGRVMQNHTAAEVAAALRRAETRAGSSSCS